MGTGGDYSFATWGEALNLIWTRTRRKRGEERADFTAEALRRGGKKSQNQSAEGAESAEKETWTRVPGNSMLRPVPTTAEAAEKRRKRGEERADFTAEAPRRGGKKSQNPRAPRGQSVPGKRLGRVPRISMSRRAEREDPPPGTATSCASLTVSVLRGLGPAAAVARGGFPWAGASFRRRGRPPRVAAFRGCPGL